MTNPYSPTTKAHAVAAHILAAHAVGRWVATAELRRRTGASVHLIAAVRARLRDEGLVGRKGDYAVCHVCGAPAIARDLCARHYQAACRAPQTGEAQSAAEAAEEEPMTTITAADLARTDADTEDHIGKVQARMAEAIANLEARAAAHDASKREEPERSGYAALQARLGDIRYGTPEYREALDEARPIIEHHYARNDHHPEHHAAGIAGMSLLSLIEMLADWKAAGERTKHGSMRQSLDVNRRRFVADSQLFAILENTARELGWLDEEACP